MLNPVLMAVHCDLIKANNLLQLMVAKNEILSCEYITSRNVNNSLFSAHQNSAAESAQATQTKPLFCPNVSAFSAMQAKKLILGTQSWLIISIL